MPQLELLTRRCKQGGCKEISAYIQSGGFEALKKVLSLNPADVIAEVEKSNLRGRGGAGFPAGLKLKLVAEAKGEKFVICNADESEVATFKDRYLLSGDPFGLIEGMLIAAYACGAKAGFIFIRPEYPDVTEILTQALKETKEKGRLNLKNYQFAIEVQPGLGAYVCGEETALIKTLENARPEPEYKPPFPPQSGIFNKPTLINNVETLINIPYILSLGAEEFRRQESKVFSVCGDVKRPGVYEMAMGSRLKELLNLSGAEDVKCVQIGGGAGKLVPQHELDMQLTFKSGIGSGGVIVFNQARDMVEMAQANTRFFVEESCGKCLPCREGLVRVVEILEKFLQNQASVADLNLLAELSDVIKISSLCGLGQTAPNMIADTLKYFRAEYLKKIPQKEKVEA